MNKRNTPTRNSGQNSSVTPSDNRNSSKLQQHLLNEKTSNIMNNYHFTNKPPMSAKSQFSHYSRLPTIGKEQVDIELGDWKVPSGIFEMLYGKFNDLPQSTTSIIKLFLSSTFSDFKVERNALYANAFPKIRQVCANLNLEFQCVDMRWGVTGEHLNQHIIESLCLQELNSCKRISLGPNFICFIGNRYGAKLMPIEIDKSEFEIFVAEIKSAKLDPNNYVDKWYRLDENNVPPIYVLQVLNEGFSLDKPLYKMEKNEAKEYQDKWKIESNELQKIFQKAAVNCCTKNLISESQKKKYFTSITEKEIRESINNNSKNKLFCYIREFNNLNIDESKADKFTDLISVGANKVIQDDLAIAGLHELKQFLLGNVGYCSQYDIDWYSGGVDIDAHDDHKVYVDRVIDNFTNNCIKSINQYYNDWLTTNSLFNFESVNSSYQRQLFGKISGNLINLPELFKEVLHHARFCGYKTKLFVERSDVFDRIRDYLRSSNRNKPLCIHSASGGGKTSICAALARKLISTNWLQEGTTSVAQTKPTVIVRFLGTSARSCNIIDLIENISAHLEVVYGEVLMKGQSIQTQDQNLQTDYTSVFHNILKSVSNKMRSTNPNETTHKKSIQIRKPLIIIIDSIDQLYSTNDAYTLNWLPLSLPPNVYLIVSCISDYQNIFSTFQYKLLNTYPNQDLKDCWYELPQLSHQFCEEMTKCYLLTRNRKITEDQSKFLIDCSMKSQSTLYMKLILDQAIKWRSFSDQYLFNQNFINTQEKAVLSLFKDLESKYGEVLVSFALGYLTASLNGLSDIEMEDVLSCNDHVLDTVYDYHDPPIPGTVRIPPLLWSRIKYELSEYLVEKEVTNKLVIYWYHRKFREVANELYCGNSIKYRELNASLAEIYLNESSIRRTIVLSNRKDLKIENADRMLTPQPTKRTNKRKLDVLPYYLIKAEKFDLLNEHCLCNLNFLICKLFAFDLDTVLKDFQNALTQTNRTSVKHLLDQTEIIYKFIIFNEKSLRIDPYSLIPLLIGQLSMDKFPPDIGYTYIKAILKQARDVFEQETDLFKSKKLLMKPLFSCLPTSNGPIKWYFEGINKVLTHSKSKSYLICIKLPTTPVLNSSGKPIDIIGYGKHKTLTIVKMEKLKVSYLPINVSLNLMDCWILSAESNSNMLFVLYETLITVYNIEKLVVITDIEIDWNQRFYLNQSLHFLSNEKYFCVANEDRIMVHVNNVQSSISNVVPKKANLTNANAIHAYLTDKSANSWEVRMTKFLSRNEQRSNTIFIHLEMAISFTFEKPFPEFDVTGTQECLVTVSKESNKQTTINLWLMWKEGLKLMKTLIVDSYVAYNKTKSECCLKYQQSKVVLGLMNGKIEIYDMASPILEKSFYPSSDEKKISPITRMKLITKDEVFYNRYGDWLIVSTKALSIHFISLNTHRPFCTLDLSDMHAIACWELNNVGNYLVLSDSSGSIHVYHAHQDATTRDISYPKLCSLHISIESVTGLLFRKNRPNDHEENSLIIISDDNILNYVDLAVFHNIEVKNTVIDEKNPIDSLKTKFKTVFFGDAHCLFAFDNDEATCVSYDALRIYDSYNILNKTVLQESKSLKFGVFTMADRAFLGCNQRKIYAWDTKTGHKISIVYDFDLESNEIKTDEEILSISRNQTDTFIHVLTTYRQIVFRMDAKKLTIYHTVKFGNLTTNPFSKYLKQSNVFNLNSRVKSYFTRDNSFIVIQFPEILNAAIQNEAIRQSRFNNICAFHIEKQIFTGFCIDGTFKSTQTGRYEPVKTINSYCSTGSEVLCIAKGNMLMWKLRNDVENVVREPTRIAKKNEKLGIKEEPQSGQNMATFGSIPNFLTFLKHSVRLYDDFPNLPELIQSEITASASTAKGDVVVTGDQFGNLIFWYRTNRTNETFKTVTNHENLDYGYIVVKEHTAEINILKVCDENRYLFSSSADRTIRVWSINNATCISSIYTHLQIDNIHYNRQTKLLMAIGSKLGQNVLLAFNLLFSGPHKLDENQIEESKEVKFDTDVLKSFFSNLTIIS